MEAHNCFMAVLIMITYLLGIMLPAAVILYPKVERRSLSMRLAAYFVCGNTLASNLVFVLVFFHILYTPVLWIALIAITVVLSFKTRRIPLKNLLVYIINFFIALLGNDLGGAFAARQFFGRLGRGFAAVGRWIRKYLLRHILETILALLFLALCVYVYQQGLISSLGYHASDVPVHNYWINEMILHQRPFVAGLYPFGYHTVIAYQYLLFHIPIMDTLSFFNYVILAFISFFLVALGKKLTRSLFLGYMPPFIYFGAKALYVNCINRYTAPLPQEFGLIFTFAGILFAIDYFRKNKKEKSLARQDEWLFAFSVSMCLSSHLYTGIILFAACICIAISRLFVFVRPSYFLPIVRSAVIGIAIAAWGIGIGALMGIPLQGSANWARQVTEQSISTESYSDQTEAVGSSSTTSSGHTSSASEPVKEERPSIREKISQTIDTISASIASNVFYSTMKYNTSKKLALYIIYAYVFFFIFSFLLRIRSVDYGRNLLFVTLFGMCLLVMFSALVLGLRLIIDMDRAKEFFVIWTCLAIPVMADSVITFVVGFKRRSQTVILDVISAAALCFTGYYAARNDLIREPVPYIQMEKNGAIISLTNILKNNRNHTYTVVSANDELHMMETQGYHVEIDELLRKIEHYNIDTSFTIPTAKVYFFIEKRPLSYYDSDFEGEGKRVNVSGASQNLPQKGGLYIYMGDNRYIEMSRMYYFAQELMRRFPEHTHVYYEDRDFECICLDQDMNSPMNLAFDYGYNK